MTELDEAIRKGGAHAQRDNPAPRLTYFRDLLARYPRTREAWHTYARALGYAGHED